ncbi:sulfite exporter TauE/SafE family protein [Actinomadura montaniterrae]|uniref:Probable membrane transporter protein n=1 Tax=Actinomadura montaniterrae TaxID=1803903 RepID=A0A6L3VWG6_9ACTN|nr:sulfite exporter TauE/SafE family protein [Actinomadura montaniterrae]KAB2384493.1 sulfite exporter TauE/SafE family protein [Actinomadura montaniterrae]
MILALTLAAAVAVGVTLGLLGGGGSILTVPILVYLAGAAPEPAIAMSLFVVGVTSAVSVLPHARAGRVRWRTGLLFGAAGMAGAYLGGRLAAYLPAGLLLAGFGVMMALTAFAMLCQGSRAPDRAPRPRPAARTLLNGAAVGLVTGLIGAGGGFLIVPALVLLGGLALPAAVGTSLLVIAANSFAGLAGHLQNVQLDWRLTLAVTGAAVAGSLAGSRLTGRVEPDRLRRVFGWFVVAMAVFVLTEQIPDGPRHALLGTPPGWGAFAGTLLALAAGAALLCRTLRPGAPRHASH